LAACRGKPVVDGSCMPSDEDAGQRLRRSIALAP
jgi:hypothetical protein